MHGASQCLLSLVKGVSNYARCVVCPENGPLVDAGLAFRSQARIDRPEPDSAVVGFLQTFRVGSGQGIGCGPPVFHGL